MSAVRGGDGATAGFNHPALLYADVPGFLEYLVPFVTEGRERGEPVVVAVAPEPLAALRNAVPGEGVMWGDTREWHPHPAGRLRAFHRLVSDHLAAGARHVRLVGEPVWPRGPREFVREWQRYESVLNHVLSPFPVTLVCTYDTVRLDPAIVETAHRTHPVVRSDDERSSPAFEDPAALLPAWNPPVGDPPPWAATVPSPDDLAAARRFLMDRAAAAGVAPDRAVDFCTAANEVLTNALVHGGGVARLSVWAEGGRLVAQIEDDGPGVADPLAGYRPPNGFAEHGQGLWLARQLVDLLQIVPRRRGTAVRLHVAADPAA